MTFTDIAYAKVNLALHVRARRDDGYHDIESVFAFVDDGDQLTVSVAEKDSLLITGEFADGLSAGPDNLVLRAIRLARELGANVPPLAVALEKNLPVAAGLGGGSADAGAMLRIIEGHWPTGLGTSNLAARSVELGADVPACVWSHTLIGHGVGEELNPASIDVAGQPILLVNPLVPCPTGQVFARWDGVDRGTLDPLAWRSARNDLTSSAISLCPDIDDVMAVLLAQLPSLSRMSGSGATCFALFDNEAALESAANRIWDDHPDWWMMAGHLR